MYALYVNIPPHTTSSYTQMQHASKKLKEGGHKPTQCEHACSSVSLQCVAPVGRSSVSLQCIAPVCAPAVPPVCAPALLHCAPLPALPCTQGKWRELTVAIKALMFQDVGASAKRVRQRAITEVCACRFKAQGGSRRSCLL